jgi:hypothetical protein
LRRKDDRAQKIADKHNEDVNTGNDVEKGAKVGQATELKADNHTNYEMRDQVVHKTCPGTTILRYKKLSVMK